MVLRRFAPLLLLLGLIAAACSDPGPEEVAGASLLPADPYELPDFDLARYELLISELEGTPVVVNIWGSWCGPCRAEAPHLAAAHAEFGDRVQFIGVDILDQRESARAFMREHGWTYPSLFDLPGAIRDGLGLLGQPVTLFYDASGVLVDSWVGAIGEAELRERIEAIAT